MYRRWLLVLAIAALVPGPLLAQEWSQTQQEVWTTVEHCWDLWDHQHDAEAFLRECWHDRVTFWSARDAAPFGKDWSAKFGTRFVFNRLVDEEYRLWPLSIEVFGNTAVVHYVAHFVTAFEDGTQERGGQKRTETLIRENNRWLAVGVHVSPIDES